MDLPPEPNILTDEIIQRQIRLFLEKIAKLKDEKDFAASETASEWKVYKLQSEIFRHFGIIDGIKEMLVSEGVIVAINDIVTNAKHDTHSDSNDLKRFPIRLTGRENPVVLKSGDPDDCDFFPYSDLIPELREQVLENLTSPQDKLNILEVFPNEAYLMKWDPASLEVAAYFEIIFPMLMRKGYLNEVDVWNLGRVDSSFRDVTLKYLDHIYVNDPDRRWIKLWNDKEKEAFMKDIGSGPEFKFSRLNPIPMHFRYNISTGNVDETPSKEELGLIGKRIWSEAIYSDANGIFNRPELLVEHLRQVPNLRSLRIDEKLEHEEEGRQEAANILELPDLPYLKFLRMKGSCPSLGKLVSSFAKTLEHLDINTHGIVPNLEPIFAPSLSKLRLCDEKGIVRDLCSTFARFEASPLKIIHVYSEDRNIAAMFPALMTALNQFGGTLEELNLSVALRFNNNRTCTGDPTWVANLHFPKMKRYFQYGFAGIWSFLLRFPKLEELTLTTLFHPGSRWSRRLFFENEHVMELSWNQEEMYKSNIWKFFPDLKKLTLYKNFLDIDQVNQSCKIDMKREDCIY